MAYALLIRHAENDWVSKKRLAGWTPEVHLNEAGRGQAKELAERLSKLPLKAIYSSPLERCMETALALAAPHDLAVTSLDEVGEVRYGKWEGKKIKKLSKKSSWHAVQHYPSRFRFPEGESLLEVQQRAVSAIESLSAVHRDELIAIVSHADVIKLALAHYLGMHIDLFQRLAISTASVSVLALFKNGSVRVLRVNDYGPIEPPATPDKHGADRRKAEDAHPDDGNAPSKSERGQLDSLSDTPIRGSETEEMT